MPLRKIFSFSVLKLSKKVKSCLQEWVESVIIKKIPLGKYTFLQT